LFLYLYSALRGLLLVLLAWHCNNQKAVVQS